VPAEFGIDSVQLGHNIDCCRPNTSRCSQNGYVLAVAVIFERCSVLVQNCVQQSEVVEPVVYGILLEKSICCFAKPVCREKLEPSVFLETHHNAPRFTVLWH